MGFGLLFLGYTLPLMPIPYVDSLPDFIGYLLMLVGLIKLTPNSKKFKYAWYTLCPMLMLSLASLVIQSAVLINDKVTTQNIPENLSGVVEDLDLVALFFKFVFHYFLLHALIDIADYVGNKKISRKCKRNWTIMLIYFLAAIIVNLPLGIPTTINNYIIYGYVLISYPVLALNAIQIYSCYMWICYEGDEDMPVPEKRSIFVKDTDEDEDAKREEKPNKKGRAKR